MVDIVPGVIQSGLDFKVIDKFMTAAMQHPVLGVILRGLQLIGKLMAPFEGFIETMGATVDAAKMQALQDEFKKVADWVASEETQTALKTIGTSMAALSAPLVDALPIISGALSVLSSPTVTKAIEDIGNTISGVLGALKALDPKLTAEEKGEVAKDVQTWMDNPFIQWLMKWINPLDPALGGSSTEGEV